MADFIVRPNMTPLTVRPPAARAPITVTVSGAQGTQGIQGPPGTGITIGTSAPTLATGAQALWIDTTGGAARMNLVTGD